MTSFNLSDTDAAQAVRDLSQLLQFETVNPPGNEGPAIDWIVERLKAHEIEHVVLESDGRPNVVARVRGTGAAQPILLAGHVDVVPVSRENWDHDPFGGEIFDGYLWGRGAIDMKYSVLMSLYGIIAAKAFEGQLSRDVIFAAVADEEAGCTHGSKFLVEHHPDLVRAEYMVGEFGGFSLDLNGVRYYPIQVGEKGVCQFKLHATGAPGHGSIPHKDNAAVKVSEAVYKLGKKRLPQHTIPVVEAFVHGLAEHQKTPVRQALEKLLNPALSGVILDYLMPEPSVANSMAANLSNTVSCTGLSAGIGVNVIPSKAHATFDGRLLPGQSKEDLFREVRDVIGRGYEFEVLRYQVGRVNRDFQRDPLFKLACANVRKHDPKGIPVPYMIPGFSDAQQFGRLGAQCLGYAPVRFPAADQVKFAELIHGHNERIHVDGFKWGMRAYLDFLGTFLGAS